MLITTTEFKNNIYHYLALSANEDIYITEEEKIVSLLTNPNRERIAIAKSLFGILPSDSSLDEAKLAAYSHLAQGMEDVEVGRVQDVDSVCDEVIRKISFDENKTLTFFKKALDKCSSQS